MTSGASPSQFFESLPREQEGIISVFLTLENSIQGQQEGAQQPNELKSCAGKQRVRPTHTSQCI